MCLAVIRTSIALGNFTTHVSNYVQKAESALEAAPDALVVAKLKVASSLALLEQKKYKLAARRFCEVPPELGSEYADVASSADVALYGGLCALASFDRGELRQHVVDNVSFRTYLEQVPDVRQLIADFYASRYGGCLAALARLRPSWSFDLHLHEHVAPLCDAIRQRALAAYVAPFSRVRLDDMAAALNTSVPALDKELAGLIQENVIAARIDNGARILYARHADARQSTFVRTLAAGDAYLRDTKALLVRASLMQHDVVQKGASRRGGGAFGMGGMGGMGDLQPHYGGHYGHRNERDSHGHGGYGGHHERHHRGERGIARALGSMHAE